MSKIANLIQLTDIKSLPEESATALKNKFKDVRQSAAKFGAVRITSHKKTTGVYMDIKIFRELLEKGAQNDPLANLTAEFDALYQTMQSPDYQDKMGDVFNASDADLKSAVSLSGGLDG